MPTAPVDTRGSVLYFEDSGVPNGSTDYITLFMIHGTCFHSAGFRPIIPFATQSNIRLVLLNVHGYPGSTPYSDEELDRLEGSLEARKAELQARGSELAAFIRWFIITEKIPPISESSHGVLIGGLSVLAWSGGNGHSLCMFAHADRLAEDTRKLFDEYLRSLILYDPSSTAAGTPAPPALKSIRPDRSLPLEEQAIFFGTQASSFYPPFTLPDTIPETPSYAPRVALHEGPGAVDPKLQPTTFKMTTSELRSVMHVPIMERAQHVIWSPLLREVFRENVRRALYDCRHDDGTGAKKKILPAVRVHVVWCDMTLGEVAWAVANLNCEYKEAAPEARRPVEFHKLEGGNHFIHWEEPARFVGVLAKII
ncbi:hypothetical protein DICSQDRAFT_183714 [Dichomitus squalens LYAD-421 SS1]|uniref:Uncharacterized protein n=2 Tax=Dichomitus squalens TaxID=114155 RepID=A0A4Q9MF56_9APHY|nr:uncharacterized protein DICSQDRAFT_183714 [Dichomitus squalens LYAD-421 SS1]EJF56674.1 hypothetical protein DICSQDRAFT_183714 [Dichomitus squalens LYAD-421 SS1]TBU26020.1 hypothetical protein BD311DRAFT_763493 [Dichomitus squalens]